MFQQRRYEEGRAAFTNKEVLLVCWAAHIVLHGFNRYFEHADCDDDS